MFIKKSKYQKICNRLKTLEDVVNNQKIELFILKNKDKYKKCTLPILSQIAFDGDRYTREEHILEFILLAKKEGIDISSININKLLNIKYPFIVVVDDEANQYFVAPLGNYGLSYSQSMTYNLIPKWSNLRKSFAPYITP